MDKVPTLKRRYVYRRNRNPTHENTIWLEVANRRITNTGSILKSFTSLSDIKQHAYILQNFIPETEVAGSG